MMQSSYGNAAGSDDDDDPFAPNPFRSSSDAPPPPQATTMQGMMQPMQQQQQQQPMMQQQQQPMMMQQPDPSSGMTGQFSLQQPPPAAPLPPTQYLSGTMDQRNLNSNPNSNNNANNTPASFFSWRSCLTCWSLETYGSYFDIDTVDIVTRLKASCMDFYRPDYFRLHIVGENSSQQNPQQPQLTMNQLQYQPNDSSTDNDSTLLQKGPDLYGPIWISFTLMFCLAVTSNLSAYYQHVQKTSNHMDPNVDPNSNSTEPSSYNAQEEEEEFEYDLNHLLRAMSIVGTFAFGVPAVYWLTARCLGITTAPSFIWWICCYGYSLVPFVVATWVVWVPLGILQWTVLAAAATCSGLLVVRNMATPLLAAGPAASADDDMNNPSNNDQQPGSPQAMAAPILLAIPVTHFIFLVVVKETFYA